MYHGEDIHVISVNIRISNRQFSIYRKYCGRMKNMLCTRAEIHEKFYILDKNIAKTSLKFKTFDLPNILS